MSDLDHLTPRRSDGLATFIKHSGCIDIKQDLDLRRCAWHKLTGLNARVWISIDGRRTIESIKQHLGSSRKIDAILKKMEEFRLIVIVDKAES